ncbi:hypothetical protein RI054_03g17830 [Pseudoscourfieldia marina]
MVGTTVVANDVTWCVVDADCPDLNKIDAATTARYRAAAAKYNVDNIDVKAVQTPWSRANIRRVSAGTRGSPPPPSHVRERSRSPVRLRASYRKGLTTFTRMNRGLLNEWHAAFEHLVNRFKGVGGTFSDEMYLLDTMERLASSRNDQASFLFFAEFLDVLQCHRRCHDGWRAAPWLAFMG